MVVPRVNDSLGFRRGWGGDTLNAMRVRSYEEAEDLGTRRLQLYGAMDDMPDGRGSFRSHKAARPFIVIA
jgi:hypothetical protein